MGSRPNGERSDAISKFRKAVGMKILIQDRKKSNTAAEFKR